MLFICLPLPFEIGRYFVPIATELHTAPISRVVLGGVVKVKDTCRVFAFLDQR
jgi:hypothetical protein